MAWLLRPLVLLLIIYLGFSHFIICLNAVPTMRTATLMQENLASFQPSKDSYTKITEEIKEENFIKGRMDIEIQDYPGSGANNRHTPRAQSDGD